MIASLSAEFVVEVRDLLIRPPADAPYDTLKAELIKRMATSAQRKLQQLISGEELGDRKPTQLLRRIQQLLSDYLGPSADNAFLKELFLQRLLANVCMVLASADDTTSDTEVKLRAEVTCLADLVTSLTQPRPRRGRSQSRGNRTHSPAPTDPGNNHKKFGEAAKKCQEPCSWGNA